MAAILTNIKPIFISTPPENVWKPLVFWLLRGYGNRTLVWSGLFTMKNKFYDNVSNGKLQVYVDCFQQDNWLLFTLNQLHHKKAVISYFIFRQRFKHKWWWYFSERTNGDTYWCLWVESEIFLFLRKKLEVKSLTRKRDEICSNLTIKTMTSFCCFYC